MKQYNLPDGTEMQLDADGVNKSVEYLRSSHLAIGKGWTEHPYDRNALMLVGYVFGHINGQGIPDDERPAYGKWMADIISAIEADPKIPFKVNSPTGIATSGDSWIGGGGGGNRGGNWPSKTGNPSGKGRGNNPPRVC